MEVSVIIPCYNKEVYVEACASSILQQDFASFEVIMVDDGSTDGTGSVCDRLAATDERLRVYHTANGGVTAARRYGVEHARGRYIMFVDSDDRLMPGAISLLHKTIEETGADEVIGSYRTQRGTVHDSGRRGWQEPALLADELLAVRNSFCVLWGIIFRRELLDGCLTMSRDIITSEDILMQIKCLMKQPKVYFIGQQVYWYNEGLPNNRNTRLDNVRAFDTELRKTLTPRWSEFKDGYLLHCVKTYESFIYHRCFYVRKYYKMLKKEDLSHLPTADYIAFMLPPRIAFIPIWLKKTLQSRS